MASAGANEQAARRRDAATVTPSRLRGDGGYLTDVRVPVALGVLVLIVVVAVLAIRIAYGATAEEEKPRVLVLGDSITDHGQRQLRDTIGPLYALSIEGQDNFRADELLPAAQRWATRDFQQVVINLGTNDVVQGWPTETTTETLTQLVSLFPHARCIHLTTVNVDLGPGADEGSRADAINEQLRVIANTDPRVRVVDWKAIVDTETAQGVKLTSDGVHPTKEGQQLLVDAYEASMDPCDNS
jgi:lysophospholipase L1-like esterase